MDFRQWQAEYHPTMADIKVRANLDLARAWKVAQEVYAVLAASKRKGFSVWRMVSLELVDMSPVCETCGPGHWGLDCPLDVDVIIRGRCDPECDHGFSDYKLEPCNGNDATCNWHGNHAALGARQMPPIILKTGLDEPVCAISDHYDCGCI